MPVGWFLAPYVREAQASPRIVRYCIVGDVLEDIRAAGGDAAWTEVLGQHAIVKVKASDSLLTQVASLAGVTRIPAGRLDDPLSTLSTAQKNAIGTKVRSLGYTMAELQTRFPNDLGTYTLRDLLKFIATRRRKVRYDKATDSIIDDGVEQPVRPVEDVDADVA